MTLLLAGLFLFLGIHAFSMLRGVRENVIGMLGGEVPYKGLYAVLSLAGFILIIRGYGEYRSAGLISLWDPPGTARYLTILLMLIAMILLAATYVHSHIRSRAKHPMILAVILWSVAHLLVNGDAGSVLLFGTFLAWGITARISMGRRTKAIFAAATLGPPLSIRNDILVIILGLTIFVVFAMWIHPVLIRAPALTV